MFLATRSCVLSKMTKKFCLDAKKVSQCFYSTPQDVSKTEIKIDFTSAYKMEEQNHILHIINTSTIEELKRYSITESRLKKILAHRDGYGLFKTFDQLFYVQGLDMNVIGKFCKSIKKQEFETKPRVARVKKDLVLPPLSEEMRMAINECTGICVHGNVISWCQIDRSCNLLHWGHQSLGDVAIKDGLVSVVDEVAKAVSKVPPSQVYIMESDSIIPFARMNSAWYYTYLQRQQIIAAIASIVGLRETRSTDVSDESQERLINNMYMLRARSPARLFGLLVGGEIVSAARIVEKMLNEFDEEENPILPIHAGAEILAYYKSLDSCQRESMNLALLTTSTFIKMVLRHEIT